ncbi:PREDICTED: proteasome assembly chaperone 2-like isoform X3 [Priapulus caudatus]|uniref:Proteasome assembly chaperone 2 n=2 Tax=Priapulus caudatus TaxID=37621 RepID=A0ABM1F9D6_PRICU|nr:PREDICTED: proteasome assembly chaperone 2-like isoform X3 [Priapulus caudatus]
MEPVCDAFYPIDGIYEELSVSLKRKVDNTQNVTTTEVMSISELDWSDYMLVLMAVDLLISTFPVKKVGYMEHEALLPIVGADPYTNSSQLSTSCEVYVAVEKQLVIIQQRSPFVKRKKSDYLKQLRSWIKLWNFRNVVMLSSLNAFYRNDAQLLGSQYRYICNKHSENQCEQQLSANGWKQLELRKDYADHPNDTFYMPGGGITKLFMNLCQIYGVYHHRGDCYLEDPCHSFSDFWMGYAAKLRKTTKTCKYFSSYIISMLEQTDWYLATPRH